MAPQVAQASEIDAGENPSGTFKSIAGQGESDTLKVLHVHKTKYANFIFSYAGGIRSGSRR